MDGNQRLCFRMFRREEQGQTRSDFTLANRFVFCMLIP